MAQTIALQRGTTSVTADGTIVTLFTQSGGTATRVILNQLSWYLNAIQNSGSPTAIVLHTSSGGQTSVLGYYRRTNGSMYSGQFLIGGNNSAWNSTGAASTGNISSNPAMTGGSGGMGNDQPSLEYSGTSTYTSSMPSTFYIGPGDSIKIKIYSSAGTGKSFVYRTANIGYSFTTITES